MGFLFGHLSILADYIAVSSSIHGHPEFVMLIEVAISLYLYCSLFPTWMLHQDLVASDLLTLLLDSIAPQWAA
jgi:hypothetical protein